MSISPETSGILIGSGSIVLAGFLAWIGANLVRLWHVPKRISRIEEGHPLILEAIALLLDVNMIEVKCQQGKKCNGDLTDAADAIVDFKARLTKHLAQSTISKKDKM